MASLVNRRPGDTFQQFLRIESPTGITSAPIKVEDGVGAATALAISNNSVVVDALVLGSDGPYSSYQDLNIPQNITGLKDVATSSASGGDVLVYNQYSQKWENNNQLDGGNF